MCGLFYFLGLIMIDGLILDDGAERKLTPVERQNELNALVSEITAELKQEFIGGYGDDENKLISQKHLTLALEFCECL